MRTRTIAALAAVVLALGVTAAVALAGGTGGTLSEAWVSDTARNNTVNHHAVGAAGDVVVAPVAAVPGAERIGPDSCTLARLAPETGATLWRASVPPEDCFTHALTEPTIGDVDGDGRPEVVAATTENATVVYAAEDGHEQARLPLTTYGYGRPTVANLTDAPTPELVTADIRGTVVAGRADGTVLWRRDLGSSTWAAPVVADVDADGRQDVLVGTNHGVVLLDAAGDVTWRADVSGDSIAVAQADADPPLEVFATGTDGVRALDGATAETEWTVETDGTPTLQAATDADRDGRPELYLGVPGNVVVAVDANGTREWRTRLAPEANAMTPAPVVGNLTGDGRQVVATTNAGDVTVLDPASGAELATYDREVPIWTFPTTANVTADPGEEILVRYGDGRVVALEYE